MTSADATHTGPDHAMNQPPRRPTLRALVALAVVALAACATGRFMELTGEEQARFNRCRDMLRTNRCANDTGSTCIDGLARDYADLPSEQERRRFLVRGGCPMSIARGESTPSAAAPAPSSGGEGASQP